MIFLLAAAAIVAMCAPCLADPMPKELVGKWCLVGAEGARYPSTGPVGRYEHSTECTDQELEFHRDGGIDGNEWGCGQLRVSVLDGKYLLRFTQCEGEGRRMKPTTLIVYQGPEGELWVQYKSGDQYR
jgi:hypothetical protein